MERTLKGAALSLALVLCFAPGALGEGAAGQEAIAGKARVVSGDTLVVQGRRIRLFGIVAPALGESCRWPGKTIPCGDVARTALMDLVAGTDVVCRSAPGEARAEAKGTSKGDGQGRLVAVCTAGGFDIGRNMVHTGWARAAEAAPRAYKAVEKKARAAKRGLWRGEVSGLRDR